MPTSINPIDNESFDPNSSYQKPQQDFYGEYQMAAEGINLLFGVEAIHNKRLQTLQDKQIDLNHRLSHIKQLLKETYNKLKENPDKSFSFNHLKEDILKLWSEWKEDLKTSNLEEYKSLTVELDKLDFEHMTLKELDDKLIPELEKIQRHFEFKFQKIPNELRLFIELFAIIVDILKEVPKRQDEMLTHINRKLAGG